MFSNRGGALTVILLFLLAFLLGPFGHSNFLEAIPGNIGDARLNNYFLENAYQYLVHGTGSLWHLDFFSPFPYVLGFSDNLFGAFPIYLLARMAAKQADTAFQIWFLAGYLANFVAATYALRRLNVSVVASCVGGLIFAFALPVTAHAGHAQLHYRFGVPLAATFFVLFLEKREWNFLLFSAIWMVWQFYCGIYMGFFTLLLVVAIAAVFVCRHLALSGVKGSSSLRAFMDGWRAKTQSYQFRYLAALGVLAVLMVVLFYPYLRVTQIYGASRPLSEIISMLPRPQSYFLSDMSLIWSSSSKVFEGIPMRHEHQMFIGAVPMVLAVVGALVGTTERNGFVFSVLPAALVVLVGVTLYAGGVSFWLLISKMPMASAIRAVTRLDLVMLFPVAYLAAVATDWVSARAAWMSRLVLVVVIPALVLEASAVSPGWSRKSEWRDRLLLKEALLPKQLSADSVLFFAQTNGPSYAAELDAMWLARQRGFATLNGYSGMLPPGYSAEFGDDCTELPRRVLSYLSFTDQSEDRDAYAALMKKIVPIGFAGCDSKWLLDRPTISRSGRIYLPEEVRNIELKYAGRRMVNGRAEVAVELTNRGSTTFAAMSSLGKPLRLSWRFVEKSGKGSGGWDTRKDLPFDIPANGVLAMTIFPEHKNANSGDTLQVSLVQEGVFWAHDVGVSPLTFSWD